MAGERIPLIVGQIEKHNDHLDPKGQEFTSQRLSLTDPERGRAVTIDLYLDRAHGYYSAYLPTVLSMESLVSLIDSCVSSYEARHEVNVEIVRGGLRNLQNSDAERKKGAEGVVVFGSKEGEGFRGEIPLVRPLDLEEIRLAVKADQLGFVRVNTLFGDFCVQGERGIKRTLGVISDVSDAVGFIEMFLQSAKYKLSKEDLELLFGEALKKFEES